MKRSSSLSDRGPTATREAFSEDELARLEREHAEGLSTQQVVDLFVRKGVPLSEASFRKYVQLGLLPRSVRVRRKSNQRGSQGLYPATVVRQIDRIRSLLAQGYSTADLREQLLVLGSEIAELSGRLERVLEAMERALTRRGRSGSEDVLSAAVAEARALAGELVGKLRAIDRSLAMRARMAKAAV